MDPGSSTSLRQQLHPLICQLADCIESVWQTELDLTALTMPEDLGYVEGRLEGEKLVIENRCFQTPEFRKLHLELARVGSNLDILHCVMFPRPNYPLPFFGTDIVGGRGQISAAIVDLSPANASQTLSETYCQALSALPATAFSQVRELPDWGDIFSEFCLFIRPADAAEEAAFLKRVEGFLRVHCQRARQTTPVTTPAAAREILEGQRYYCQKQQQNDKTRRVLEKAFGPEWTERYMTTMLFDTV